MAIGALICSRLGKVAGVIALAFVFLILRAGADDQIKKNDGTIIPGEITGVSGDQVDVTIHNSNGSTGKTLLYLSDIESVTMPPPADVAKAQGAAPKEVIAILEPKIKQFAGLPTDWVVNAMAQLADAYAATGQPDRALALYTQITQSYPGSAYMNVAQAGKAKLSLQQGKIDDALAAVQPIVEAANKNLAPSQSEGGLYASAFLVYGQVLAAQKKPREALEAYLTVKTMFYQNPAMVAQAEQLAQALRDQNPGLGIE